MTDFLSKKLLRRRASVKTKALKSAFKDMPNSWIEFIREALGISQTQLAKRLGVAQSVVKNAQEREKEGSITLKKLDEIARSMGHKVVYALVPIEDDIEEIVQKRALLIAKEILGESSLTMELEDQGTEEFERKAQLEDLAEKIKFSKELWN